MADVLVGITMRVLRDPASGESRDALAQDWAHFFNALFPGRPWLMLPNTGEACPALAQGLGVNALVLSGGDDIGMTPLRDATETALLRWAASRNLPVLGICRGLQMLQHFFGGQLVPLAAERHLRIRHQITGVDAGERQTSREVNSYHQWGIRPEALAPDLTPLALCAEDGSVEAARAHALPWRGIMWHPEREAETHPADLQLFREVFLPQRGRDEF